MSDLTQKKYQEFVIEEARWLDSVVRELIPKWMQNLVEKRKQKITGRLAHFFIDYFYIPRVLGITIKRNQDTELLNGKKGFRQGMDHGYCIRAVRTQILRHGELFQEKKFVLNIIIKN